MQPASEAPSTPRRRKARSLIHSASSPIARRDPVALPRVVSKAEEAAFATVEAELGGREKLVAALSLAKLSERERQVVGMIADPDNDGRSLARICAQGEIGLGRLLGIFREAVLARGQVIAITRIAQKVPDVAAAVMEDATPGWRICLACLGAKQVEEKNPDTKEMELVPCGRCNGRGEVYHRPDHDVQKTALQISGLLDKGGAKITTIVAQQQTGGGGSPDTGMFDQLMGALDGALYGKGRDRLRRQREEDGDGVVEGEVEDASYEGNPEGSNNSESESEAN